MTLKDLEKQRFGKAMEKARAETIAYFKKERRLNDPVAERKRVVIFLMTAVVVVANALASSVSYLAGGTVALLVLGLFCASMSAVIAYRLTSDWEMRGKFTKFYQDGGIGPSLHFLAMSRQSSFCTGYWDNGRHSRC